MAILQEDPEQRPEMRRALAQIREARLVACGVRWGQTETDLSSLIEGRCAELLSGAGVLEAQAVKYADDLALDVRLTVVEAVDEAISKLLVAKAAVLR